MHTYKYINTLISNLGGIIVGFMTYNFYSDEDREHVSMSDRLEILHVDRVQ